LERARTVAIQIVTDIATSGLDAIASTSAGTFKNFQRRPFIGRALAKGRVTWFSIPNPIDPALLKQPPPRLSEVSVHIPEIVSAGRLVPQKRFDVFLAAIAEVRKVREVHATIFGEGRLLGALQRQAKSLGIKEIVEFRPFESDLDRVYGHADLFALTSDFEGFGNVIVEALAYGLPVVATDAPYGPTEILDEGQYGLVVPRGDHRRIAEAMLAALPGGPEHARLIATARQRAERYAADRVAQEMHDCAATVAERRRRQRNGQLAHPVAPASPRNAATSIRPPSA
jgi:glycosyltransferase involved in cell wall biosynthesis